jgi:hypothetical protein
MSFHCFARRSRWTSRTFACCSGVSCTPAAAKSRRLASPIPMPIPMPMPPCIIMPEPPCGTPIMPPPCGPGPQPGSGAWALAAPLKSNAAVRAAIVVLMASPFVTDYPHYGADVAHALARDQRTAPGAQNA